MRWSVLVGIVLVFGAGEADAQDAPIRPAPPPPDPAAAAARPVYPYLRQQLDRELAEARSLLATHLRGLATTTAGADGDEREALVWDSAVYGGKDDYYDWFTTVPAFRAMVEFATRPLSIDGRPIVEKARASANRRFGKATCEGSTAVLLHGDTRPRSISPMAYTFFREHEYGHFVLKHSACPLTGPGPSLEAQRNRELEADCRAAQHLMGQGSWGQMVVGVAIDRLAQLDLKESGTHPSSRARVQNLMQCKPMERVK